MYKKTNFKITFKIFRVAIQNLKNTIKCFFHSFSLRLQIFNYISILITLFWNGLSSEYFCESYDVPAF